MNHLINASDILSLHCFLSPETHGMINMERIARMRENVIVLNCARGELVDSKAMRSALESGRVGGYGSDVLDTEPPAADHPLLLQGARLQPQEGSGLVVGEVVRRLGRARRRRLGLGPIHASGLRPGSAPAGEAPPDGDSLGTAERAAQGDSAEERSSPGACPTRRSSRRYSPAM